MQVRLFLAGFATCLAVVVLANRAWPQDSAWAWSRLQPADKASVVFGALDSLQWVQDQGWISIRNPGASFTELGRLDAVIRGMDRYLEQRPTTLRWTEALIRASGLVITRKR